MIQIGSTDAWLWIAIESLIVSNISRIELNVSMITFLLEYTSPVVISHVYNWTALFVFRQNATVRYIKFSALVKLLVGDRA